MWHEGMQQPQCRREHKIHHCQGRSLFRFILAENVSLGRFNKPITIIAPDEIIEMLGDQIEVIFAIRRLDCVDCLIHASEHFDGVDRESSASLRLARKRDARATLHLAKTSYVPELGRKVTA